MAKADGPPFRLEADFRRAVVRVAREAGWDVHWEVDSRFKPSSGFPDLVLGRLEPAPVGARVKLRELKMDNTYLKPKQDDWRVILERAGLDHAVWRPRDWDAILRELE